MHVRVHVCYTLNAPDIIVKTPLDGARLVLLFPYMTVDG